MLIKDELTQKLDRNNGTKLKRMYKWTDQDMLQIYKVVHFCEMEMFMKGGTSAIIDRRIDRWFAKSLRKNRILCVHVIGYKLGYMIIYKLEYGTSFGQDWIYKL